MAVRQYLDSLAKEELIELLKKLEVNDIIISGAFASTDNAIVDMIEKDFSNEVSEIIREKISNDRHKKLNDLGIYFFKFY
jgi:hypothetical protein